MYPEGRNVDNSYSLSLEFAAVLGLAVIHRELQRHLYPAAHLQLQLLRSLGKVTHRLAGNGVDAVAQHVGLQFQHVGLTLADPSGSSPESAPSGALP